VAEVASPPAFVVARNPDADSQLPYLLRLPIDGGLLLKAREPWPTTARVYCHPLTEGWPPEPEILEEVPVRVCTRRGRAVDLVLDRARNNRSQFVFTQPHPGRRGGRTMIFWQTARTARRSRPGQRVPTARAADGATLALVVDSRERYPYRFAGRAVETERGALPVGDYGIVRDGAVVAVVERKTPEDLIKSLVDGTLGFAMAELSGLPAAAVVVEERYAKIAAAPRVQAGWPCELLVQLQLRYPCVSIVFADSRKLAEDWTHRFLAAASTGAGR
jgi:hypothetical protein